MVALILVINSSRMAVDLPPTFVPGWSDDHSVHRIPYNRFGETDMIVSRIGIGKTPYCGSS